MKKKAIDRKRPNIPMKKRDECQLNLETKWFKGATPQTAPSVATDNVNPAIGANHFSANQVEINLKALIAAKEAPVPIKKRLIMAVVKFSEKEKLIAPIEQTKIAKEVTILDPYLSNKIPTGICIKKYAQK